MQSKNSIKLAVIVAALGYFVDVYDLVLFSIVRTDSLKSLGLSGDDLLQQGIFLLNCQMAGLLLGGIFWGILGDRKGRIEVLFGSILLYSIANILNAYVTEVWQYAILRFVAGIGLAGEVGAGITLVSELMPAKTRGLATTFVASVGVSGAIVAGVVGEYLDWRSAYIVGGVGGLMLLVLRVSAHESKMFAAVQGVHDIARGDLRLFFRSKERFYRYINSLLVGIPIWYAIGIIVTFSPEIGVALGIAEPLKAGKAVFYSYIGLTCGDLLSGLISQLWRSRRKVIFTFILGTLASTLLVLNSQNITDSQFYLLLVPMGVFVGYWAVFLTAAAEQFGTNIRATVATTAPNFVRGMVIPITFVFNALKPELGVLLSAQLVGVLVCGIAVLALYNLRETFGRDLEFTE